MSECSPDAFAMAGRTETPMNVVAVIQHTSAEYLGLMEDHLEGRRIRFQYFRPFARGGKLPAADLPADALILLGGGPWGSSGKRDLPTLAAEIELCRGYLQQGTPVIGIGLGAQILAIAAGGGVERCDLVFETNKVMRSDAAALNGFLPEEFVQAVYMRDWPVPPEQARILARDERGRVALFQIANNAYGFAGHPGIKLGMVEDLIMEFEEVPQAAHTGLEILRALQPQIEDNLVPIMTGLVQCTALMSAPKAVATATEELDTPVI
ncbi:MAG: gamma-glutamyl-gamma-aminobutyrate hydrolase family protein [Gammaproteobacteria bacterium]|nr:gamma-glutamyl-gamma-aminobutyrate hydrolase family protein [Gammaproteobacteria bacterium]